MDGKVGRPFTALLSSEINKLSRGKICVANFKPPANGASQGNYIQAKILTPYTGVCGFFLQVKFATSLLASLAGDTYNFIALLVSWAPQMAG